MTKTIDRNRYRSGLERDMARQLRLAGVSFEFETVKIDYIKPAKSSKYNPDFLIRKNKSNGEIMFIEGKGRFLTADRQKHLLIRDQKPELDIRFVFSNGHEKIGKTSNTTYVEWCEKKGFKYGTKGKIPKEWLEE